MQELETEEQKPDQVRQSFYRRNKKLVTIVGIVIFAIVIVGCALAIVLPQSFDKPLPNRYHESLKSRIDCLPWAKANSEYKISDLCKQNSFCRYEDIDNNVNVPSCYIDKNAYKNKFISKEDTQFGKYYLIESNKAKIRIDFEFLDDNTLRFKVFYFYL